MDYWYDAQLRKFIKQFMAIFSTFSVKISEDSATQVMRNLPCIYGGSSRMVQSIIRNNSENMANTVPMMSCYVQDLLPNSEYGKKIHTYAQKNPKKSIIVQDDKTGHMVYLRKFSQMEK